ncbi:MAG: ATP-binding protein [Bacteroidales bacterium]|nr:ATP-binding protein [Bacteroidales bacterium]
MSLPSEISKLSETEMFLESLMRQFEIKDDFLGILSVPLHECVENAIVHGNKCNKDKTVLIEICLDQSKLLFSITDEGEGFDYNSFLQQNIEQSKNNGLFLVQLLTEELSFAKNGSQISYKVDVPLTVFGNDKRINILQQSQTVVKNPQIDI